MWDSEFDAAGPLYQLLPETHTNLIQHRFYFHGHLTCPCKLEGNDPSRGKRGVHMALDRPVHASETADETAARAVDASAALVNEPPTTPACPVGPAGGQTTLTTHHSRWRRRQVDLTPSREREEAASSDGARLDGALPGSGVSPDPSDVGLSRRTASPVGRIRPFQVL